MTKNHVEKSNKTENCKRGTIWAFQFVAQCLKIEGGPFGDIRKFSKFSKKMLKKRKMRILKQPHSAEKPKKGDPLGF